MPYSLDRTLFMRIGCSGKLLEKSYVIISTSEHILERTFGKQIARTKKLNNESITVHD